MPRLFERNRGLGGLALGAAVHRVDKVLIDKILRGKFKALGVGAFPGRGPQVARRHFAFAAVELRHLAEFERIALAGATAKIVKDAPAHAGELRIGAGSPKRQIVDRAVRNQANRRGGALVLPFCDGERSEKHQAEGQ